MIRARRTSTRSAGRDERALAARSFASARTPAITRPTRRPADDRGRPTSRLVAVRGRSRDVVRCEPRSQQRRVSRATIPHRGRTIRPDRVVQSTGPRSSESPRSEAVHQVADGLAFALPSSWQTPRKVSSAKDTRSCVRTSSGTISLSKRTSMCWGKAMAAGSNTSPMWP